MKMHSSAYRFAWITTAWAALGVALPIGVVWRVQKLNAGADSVDDTVQQIVNSVSTRPHSKPAGAAADGSAAGGVEGDPVAQVAPDAGRSNDALAGGASRPDPNSTGLFSASTPRTNGVRQATGYRINPPGSLIASANVTESASSAVTSQPAQQSATGPATIRLQDEALPAGAGETSGVSLGTIGLGVLAVGGVTAATLAIIEATDDPASP